MKLQKSFDENQFPAGLGIEPGDKVHMVALRGNERHMKRAAHLTLHRIDLEFAGSCLDELGYAFFRSDDLQEALWRSAIIHVMKCFSSSGREAPYARFKLDEAKVFKGAPEARQSFEDFKKLRNKHVAHDEGFRSEAGLAVVLRERDGLLYYGGLVAQAGVKGTRKTEELKRLRQVIAITLEYVHADWERVTDLLVDEFKNNPPEDILSAGPLLFPRLDDESS